MIKYGFNTDKRDGGISLIMTILLTLTRALLDLHWHTNYLHNSQNITSFHTHCYTHMIAFDISVASRP